MGLLGPFELLFLGLTVYTALPMWLVEYPPIQDLPQHLAAIRLLFDYGDEGLRYREYFDLTLGSTQYLSYYVAAWLLSFPLGVTLANKVLVSAAIIGTPYAMRGLLRALGRDQRLALLLLPLAWNAHLILGFINFVGAIPLTLWGLTLAVRLRHHYRRRTAVTLAALAVVTFYTHVVPFAFLGLGAALISIGDGYRATFRRWLPLVPAALFAMLWTQTSPAGQSTLTAAQLSGGGVGGPEPQFVPFSASLRDIPAWLTDVLHGEVDDKLLVFWGVLVIAYFAFGAGSRPAASAATPSQRLSLHLLSRLGVLAPLAAIAYFITPASYDWIWPINARFPLLALVFLVPALPKVRGLLGVVLMSAVIALSIASASEVSRAFVTYEEDEVGEFDQALAAIPEGKRVAGLIWDRGSREVKFSPFIQYVSYYQAQKGGAVMFTFADFPQSPFRFREDNRPPRVYPRWEWMPERVDPERDLPWYDYVLVRGGPGAIAQQRAAYEPIFRGPRWSVWQRRGGDL